MNRKFSCARKSLFQASLRLPRICRSSSPVPPIFPRAEEWHRELFATSKLRICTHGEVRGSVMIHARGKLCADTVHADGNGPQLCAIRVNACLDIGRGPPCTAYGDFFDVNDPWRSVRSWPPPKLAVSPQTLRAGFCSAHLGQARDCLARWGRRRARRSARHIDQFVDVELRGTHFKTYLEVSEVGNVHGSLVLSAAVAKSATNWASSFPSNNVNLPD